MNTLPSNHLTRGLLVVMIAALGAGCAAINSKEPLQTATGCPKTVRLPSARRVPQAPEGFPGLARGTYQLIGENEREIFYSNPQRWEHPETSSHPADLVTTKNAGVRLDESSGYGFMVKREDLHRDRMIVRAYWVDTRNPFMPKTTRRSVQRLDPFTIRLR